MGDNLGRIVNMKCLFCDEPATCCITVSEGDKPEKPQQEGTQSDHRRVIKKSICNNCVISLSTGNIKITS